jgi:predicted Zn finger-like uncharacterized protein
MRIVCPNCSTSYDISVSKLGPQGRSVRCARCHETWTARSQALVIEAEPLSWESMPGERESAVRQDVAEREPQDAAEDEVWPETAEPAVVADAPPLSPADDVETQDRFIPAKDEIEPSQDIETAALLRARPASPARRRQRHSRGLPLTILAFVAAIAALISWRADVVRLVPQTAGVFRAIGLPVNLRGLIFEDIEISDETKDGVPVLVVEGRIINLGKHAVEVPRVRLAIRSGAGVEVYAWTALPDRPVLNPGEALPFRSRLASPPIDAKDVLVRFFHRRDLVAGQ